MRLKFLPTLCLLSFLSAASGQLDTVRLQLKWLHQFQFAGYYAAIEQGYYEEEGLHVELIEPELGEDPMEAVWEGRAEYGVSTSDIVLYRAQGKPVVALAVIYQHSPYILLGVHGEEFDNLHDLVGKKLMMEPNSADIHALLRFEQVDLDQVELVPHTFNTDDLLKGKVAATSAYITDEPFNIMEAGRKPVIFSPRMAGIDFYGDGLFTTEDEITNNPERVEGFLRASLRGWKYALSHPEEIVDLILEKYSDRKSREQLLYEAMRTYDLVRPDLVEVGYMYPGRWSHIVAIFQEAGFLEGDFDLTSMLYQIEDETPWTKIILSFAGILVVLLLVILVALQMYLDRRKLDREVTKRAQSEAVLSQMEQRYRMIFIDAPISFIIFNADWKILEWNREAERIFGWSREEVLGKDVTFLIPDDDNEFIEKATTHILNKGVLTTTNWNLTKSGSKIWCKWHNVAALDEKGGFKECHSIAIDLTAEHENEQRLQQAKIAAEALNEKKDEVLAQVSHEIRNPLNAIIGCSDIMRDMVDEVHAIDLLDTIESSAQSLVELLNDLLDFSKIEAGRLEIVRERVQICNWIEKSISLYRVPAEQKGIQLLWQPKQKEVFEVQTDPARVTQILRNFISNAVKFTPQGSVSVGVRWVEGEEGSTWLEVSVADTGVGISQEDMDKLFLPYTQAGDHKIGIEGTGLGLALCKQLARLLGGRIEVQSEVGKGSVFSLLLPVDSDENGSTSS